MAGERDEGKRSAGEAFSPPPHSIWNNMIDAGQAHANSKLSTEAPPLTEPRDSDVLKVKNISCGNRRRGEVLAVCSKLITNLDAEHLWVNAATPSEAMECFGILLKPTPADKIKKLQVSGRALALVNRSSTDTVGKRCKVVSGSVVLQEDEEGDIDIIWGPGSTGEQECIVLLTDPCPTTTTTTSDPAVTTTASPEDLQCEGFCSWKMLSGTWTLQNDYCNQTTTSDPCPCPVEAVDCECIPPSECAPEATQIVTFCSTLTFPDPPFCSTTTSTTTTTTSTTTSTTTTTGAPTTTCDCSLTTTTTINPLPHDCTKGCDWVWIPAYGWTATAYGCWWESCPCFPPEGLPGDPDSCPTAHTHCYTTVPPVTTVPGCDGSCTWQCVNDVLYFVDFNCSTQTQCGCSAPASCVGCGSVVVGCGSPPTSTTTTTTCDPADCYCICRPPPTTSTSTTSTTSGPTTTSTTSTTSTTTTTTVDPCTDNCFWDRAACPDPWNLVTACSDGSCGCDTPPLVQWGYCDTGTWTACTRTTSTTTSGPTTTTTTSSPTTTCDPATNDCSMTCVYSPIHGYIWSFIPSGSPSGQTDYCCGEGTCTIPYCFPCIHSTQGSVCNGYCTPQTTAPPTTSATPTTTPLPTTPPPTTTGSITTTTANPCVGAGCEWIWDEGSYIWVISSTCDIPCSCIAIPRAGAYDGESVGSTCE